MAISRNARTGILFAGLLAGIAFIAVVRSGGSGAGSPSVPGDPVDRENSRTGAIHREPARLTSPGSAAAPDVEIVILIRNALVSFRNHPDPEQARAVLRSLREGISHAREAEAAAAILAFLKSGGDATTGLPFTVAPEGMMDAVPTLRIALLDLLPSLDPTAALDVAREIMAGPDSPDEYALCLRNMAWNDLNGDLRNELSARFLDLLETPWLDDPSAGFLESLDIAVEVGGKPMFDRMVTLARQSGEKPDAAVSRAVAMSLDRMVVRDPSLLVAACSGDPGWMDFAPMQRASLMSRLDLAEPAQRELFQRYISSPTHAAGELDYFARIFPNENFLFGNRLVTTGEVTPTIDQVAASDARVIRELDGMSLTGDAAVAIRTIRDHLKSTGPER